MTNPVYKIETYTGVVRDHTIEKEALSIHTKEVLTDNVGIFSFSLPAVKGKPDPYYFDDIDVGDTAKIYLGYDAIAGGATPDFIGKIFTINGVMDKDGGYIRTFSGRSQGHVLQDRFKTTRWEGVSASTAVTTLATDLSLGTGDIEVDGTQITLQVDDKKYIDILKTLSDYWASGASYVTKDFYVDVDNDLVWATRDGTSPFRSGANVETLTVGKQILSYIVSRDMTNLYNKITVLGAREKPSENDVDHYTEATTGWSAPAGGTITTNADSVEGSNSIQITEDPSSLLVLRLHLATTGNNVSCLYDKDFKTFNFNVKVPSGVGNVGTISMRLWNSGLGDYFNQIMTPEHHGVTVGGEFKSFTLPIGKAYEAGPYNGTWQLTTTPVWTEITDVEIRVAFTGSGAQTARVDKLFFGNARFIDVAEDSTSQTNYGTREMFVTDDSLRSDSECESMGEALIDMYKDPATQIEVTVKGNTNILVGDRLSMTIPAENISAANYDVFTVEHFWNNQGATTKAVMQSSTKHRRKIPTNQRDFTVATRRLAKEAWMVKRVAT